MKKPPRQPTARTVRREQERSLRRSIHDLDRLASAERGGSRNFAIAVTSPTQVDVHARGLRCHRCGGSVRLEDHTADIEGDTRVRVAHVRCVQCGTPRRVYFQIAQPMLH